MQYFDATKLKCESFAKVLSHQQSLAAFLINVTGAACQLGADSSSALLVPTAPEGRSMDLSVPGRLAAFYEVRRRRSSPEQLKGSQS
jgi:hypothetical protein